ncbi:MAG: hypothetical protein ACOYJB_00665 [Christensenellaceae bacterium]|jgi:rubrerythrin
MKDDKTNLTEEQLTEANGGRGTRYDEPVHYVCRECNAVIPRTPIPSSCPKCGSKNLERRLMSYYL